MDTLAVDIGSNTIKCLLGSVDNSRLNKIFERTLDIRISSVESSTLVENAAELIAKAIKIFKTDALKFSKNFKVVAVATSAIRESSARGKILEAVYSLCGCKIKILDGDEEARLSYIGAMSDPLIDSTASNAFFDLGGGSLEIVFGKAQVVDSSISTPIGAVNLTRKFVADPKSPVNGQTLLKIENFARETLDKKLMSVPRFSSLVGAGGAVVAARFAKKTLGLEGAENIISLGQMRFILSSVSAATADERLQKYGVSAGRTDIVPAAFASICALMEKLGAKEIVHTFNNLRYGLIIDEYSSRLD